MRTNLQNPFYFIKDCIIFNIQGSNTEKDECGKHYKTFDTESVELKRELIIMTKTEMSKLPKMTEHLRLV